ELAAEELLDDLLEDRQEARVMRRDAALERRDPLEVAEHAEVLVRERAAALLDEVADLLALVGVGESDAVAHELLDRLIAPGPAEDEDDRRQQPALREQAHNLGARHSARVPRRCPRSAAPGASPAPAVPAGAPAAARFIALDLAAAPYKLC